MMEGVSVSKASAVDYALRIIELFSENQNGIGIADICNSLEINKNAATRVLGALLEYNWIYLSDNVRKKYRFTLKPFSIVSKTRAMLCICFILIQQKRFDYAV